MADGRSIVATGGNALAPRREGALVRPSKADADLVIGRAGAELQGPRGFAHLLLFIIAAFFGIFFAWASWATLDEVTRGDGKVIPSSQVQVVQNLEGGISVASWPRMFSRSRSVSPASRLSSTIRTRCGATSLRCSPDSSRAGRGVSGRRTANSAPVPGPPL
jgi:hypothetical protein